MRQLTLEEKAALERSVRDTLEELELSDSFRYSITSVDTGGFVFVVAPCRPNLDLSRCQALTKKGRRCRLDPKPGKAYCAFHLSMQTGGDNEVDKED